MDDFEDMSVMLGPGIYVLARNEHIEYVGKTKRLVTRIYSHANLYSRWRKTGVKPKGPFNLTVVKFNKVWIRPCEISDLDRLERETIRALQPRYNINFNGYEPIKRKISELGFMTINGTTINFAAEQSHQVTGTRRV